MVIVLKKKIKGNNITPVIVVDNGNKPKEANSDLDLSYKTLHKHLKEANDYTTTVDLTEVDNDNV